MREKPERGGREKDFRNTMENSIKSAIIFLHICAIDSISAILFVDGNLQLYVFSPGQACLLPLASWSVVLT